MHCRLTSKGNDKRIIKLLAIIGKTKDKTTINTIYTKLDFPAIKKIVIKL